MTQDIYTRLAPPIGKKVVIVGGCGGIGKAVVEACLINHLQVAVVDLPRSILENPMREIGVIVFPCDATKADEIENVFKKIKKLWGHIDHLVNLAGFTNPLTSIETLSEEIWQETIDGNLKSTFLCCKYAIPLFNTDGTSRNNREGGSIVNMSSGLAVLGNAGYTPYAIAKNGIITLTRTLATELAPNIRVNAVAPGAVLTPFLSKGTGRGGYESDKPERINVEEFVKRVPAGRIAIPEDIAAPILFLMSDAARYINGQVLHINGGALFV
jgi:3-oxoacyl-[acyl-carrier protein] reductase